MPLEPILDTEDHDEDTILQMGFNPDPIMLENLSMLTRYSESNSTSSLEIVGAGTPGGSSLVTVPTASTLSSIAGSAQARSFQVSESGRVENSGNINFNFNYFPTTPGGVETLPPAIAHIEAVGTNERTLSSSSDHHRDEVVLLDGDTFEDIPTTPIASPESPQHGQEQSYDPSGLFMEREDGCYLQTVKPSLGNIPFHPNTSPEVRSFMSSKFTMFESDRIIPLWNPKVRQDITRINIRTIGDVGHFDDSGGFHSLFNIFLTEEENHRLGYTPPPNFTEYTNQKTKQDIVKCRPMRPLALSGTKHSLRFSLTGKFQHRIPALGTSILSFCTTTGAQTPSHGSAIVCHDSLKHQLDESKHHAQREYMQPYFNRYARGWYKYYNERGIVRPTLKSGALVLVDMTWSTDSWASAAFLKEPVFATGAYYANLISADNQHPNVYAWDAHVAVDRRTHDMGAENTRPPSYCCVGVGVSSIFIGNPPGYMASKMKNRMTSISQSFSTISLSSMTSSIRNSALFRRNK